MLLHHSDAGAVISSILEAMQTFQQEILNVSETDVPYDSAHTSGLSVCRPVFDEDVFLLRQTGTCFASEFEDGSSTVEKLRSYVRPEVIQSERIRKS
jgi:hypothetical protein